MQVDFSPGLSQRGCSGYRDRPDSLYAAVRVLLGTVASVDKVRLLGQARSREFQLQDPTQAGEHSPPSSYGEGQRGRCSGPCQAHLPGCYRFERDPGIPWLLQSQGTFISFFKTMLRSGCNMDPSIAKTTAVSLHPLSGSVRHREWHGDPRRRVCPRVPVR